MRADALCSAWRTPGVGAVSCSSTGPGGYRAPGFVSHSLVWLSMAFHTFLVKACWRAKEGTIRRRRWHAGGDRIGLWGGRCDPPARRAGHDRPPFHDPHALGLEERPALDQGGIGARAPASFLPPYPGGPRLQAAEQGHAGEESLRKSTFDGLSGVGQGAHGQIPQREDPGARQRLRLPFVPSPLGVWRGGLDCARLQEVACPLVGVPLEGCREAEPLCRGCHWEAAPGPAPGVILVGRPGVEVRAISSAVPMGASSGARCHMTASIAHVEKGHARGGVYTWMIHCGHDPRTRDAWSTPRTMSAARTSTIPEGSTMIPCEERTRVNWGTGKATQHVNA